MCVDTSKQPNNKNKSKTQTKQNKTKQRVCQSRNNRQAGSRHGERKSRPESKKVVDAILAFGIWHLAFGNDSDHINRASDMAHSNSQVNPRCVSRFRTFIPPQHHYWTWPQDLQGRDCFVLLGCRTSVDDLENLACHPHVVAASTSNRGAIFEVEIGFACLRTGIFREHPFHRGANQGVSNNAHFFFFFGFCHETAMVW